MSAVEGGFFNKVGVVALWGTPLVIMIGPSIASGFTCLFGPPFEEFNCKLSYIPLFTFIAAFLTYLILAIGAFMPSKLVYKIIWTTYVAILFLNFISILYIFILTI